MNVSAAKIMSKVILTDRNIKIKLLGDSITHGVGGTGFEQNGEPIVRGYSRNKDGYCWAKLFKEFMEEQFDCTVVNNGCTGTRIDFIIDNFDQLVDADDDIIICTIGTNNRHQYIKDGPKKTKREYMQTFYDKIIKLSEKFKSIQKDVIFIANIPASAQNEKDQETFWRLFHMNDISDLYLKASFECGFPFISLYSQFLQYCDLKNIDINTLFTDGLHPNDNGYDIMFKLIMNELGIARKVTDIM